MIEQVLYNTFNLESLLAIVVGLAVGIIFGVIPGLSGITAIALLTPFSYGMKPIVALVLMSAIYCGAVYAGSISAILFNCPGDIPAVATSTDGYPMRKNGEASRALAAAMMSSGVGGIAGIAIGWPFAMSLVQIAFKFGPPEYFAFSLLGLSLVSSIGSKNQFKGLVSALLGLLIATIGTDPIQGVGRFHFGQVALYSGINYVPSLIGLYALAEVFNQFANLNERRRIEKLTKDEPAPKATFMSKSDIKLALPHWIRNSIMGTIVGIFPGAGSVIAAFLGYGISKNFSKTPEKFGKGAIEGVIGPETANNASVGGAMVPLLTMGIPGSTCAALILNVYLIHGLQPGPLLFKNMPEMVHPIFLAMLISNVLILFVPMLFIKYIIKVLKVPYEYVGVAIIMFALIGGFSISNRLLDVWTTVIFGIIGFCMVKFQYSPSALALGFVLGPILERGLRQSLMLFKGDVSGFLYRPIAIVMLTGAILIFVVPMAKGFFKYLKNRTAIS